MRSLLLLGLIFGVLTQAGCGWLNAGILGPNDTATVIAKTAQIRTSYAVVAADLLEVKRGDNLDVIDQLEFEKVQWFRVRAHDEAATEGCRNFRSAPAVSVQTPRQRLCKVCRAYPNTSDAAPRAFALRRTSEGFG